jgi:hypothetical protein
MDGCYFSLIRRSRDGELVGWVPDLYGITAAGRVDGEVLRLLAHDAGELLGKMTGKGLPLPRPTPPHALPLGDREGRYRRLLLTLSDPLSTGRSKHRDEVRCPFDGGPFCLDDGGTCPGR